MNAQIENRKLAQYKSLTAALEHARQNHEEWFFEFDSLSNLLVCAAADAAFAAHLIQTAPTPFLAGLITGLYLNN